MDGVLVVDKPAGMTSHDVVARVRRAAGMRKVGHAGTLDPSATGVLVTCLGKATRLVPYLQASVKTYDARMRLGQTTTTLDADGDMLAEHDASGVDEALLCEVLKTFVGVIEQVPPMVSAVRVGGERLYAKARRGEEVDRPARTVTVHDIVLSDFEPGPAAEAVFLVTCSPGTYVRTLAADIGDQLGVGAHLIGLRRLASGRFRADAAVTVDELGAHAEAGTLDQVVLSMAEAMADYPTVRVDPGVVRNLAHGRPITQTGHDGPVGVLDESGALVALVSDRDGAARPLAVFTAPDQLAARGNGG